MSLSRVWIIDPHLSPSLAGEGDLAQYKESEIKIVPNLDSIEEEIEAKERLIILTTSAWYEQTLKKYGGKILAIRVIPETLDASQICYFASAVLRDAVLQHDLEALEHTAWTGNQVAIFDDPTIELIGKTVLAISSCRDLIEVEEVLLNVLGNLTPTLEVRIAFDPPYLPSKILGSYQLAIPIYLQNTLQAHVYIRTAPETNIETIANLVLNLGDVIALSVERNKLILQAEQTKLIWEASFNAVEDSLLVLSQDFSILKSNKAFAKFCRKNDLKVTNDLFKTHFLKTEWATNLEAHHKNHEWDFSFKEHWFRIYFDPIIEKFDQSHWIARIRDTDEEHTLTEKILAGEHVAELGILVGSVAHEINNPIGGILALSQMLLKEVPRGTELHEDLSNIHDAADRCKKIVQTMLSLVRKTDNTKEEIELSTIVASTLEIIASEAQRLGIVISFTPLPKGFQILGNKNRLMQICFHLIQGALQAIEEKRKSDKSPSQISIELVDKPKTMELEILDNGSETFHQHALKNSVAYAVAQLLTDEAGGSLEFGKLQERNSQKLVFSKAGLGIS